MKSGNTVWIRAAFFGLAALLSGVLLWQLKVYVPGVRSRYRMLAVYACFIVLAVLWEWHRRRQVFRFADDLCRTMDALIAGHKPENYQPYEDTLAAKIQSGLIRYNDIVNESRMRSMQDKQTIQELVSDISHQVKTPVASIRMFAGILRKHRLTEEKRTEFLRIMEEQIDKLDFLMRSLIKMSRLETGTFVLHAEELGVNDTIARAINTVWAKAESKNIQLSVECGTGVTVRHDPKWTAEALGNILDNAVKYTLPGGSITIFVRPWQFYTRIDISDTGIGIPEEHYHDVFRRFYRAPEAGAEEGVGLGLYLANSIITSQNGYISVKSKVGEGTTFSVYLLN